MADFAPKTDAAATMKPASAVPVAPYTRAVSNTDADRAIVAASVLHAASESDADSTIDFAPEIGVAPVIDAASTTEVTPMVAASAIDVAREIEAASEIVFIAVGTPMGADGSADLKYVLDVAKLICRFRFMKMK